MRSAYLSKNKRHWNTYTVYQIYDEKRAFASEAAEGLALLQVELAANGYITSLTRGDWVGDATELETR